MSASVQKQRKTLDLLQNTRIDINSFRCTAFRRLCFRHFGVLYLLQNRRKSRNIYNIENLLAQCA